MSEKREVFVDLCAISMIKSTDEQVKGLLIPLNIIFVMQMSLKNIHQFHVNYKGSAKN